MIIIIIIIIIILSIGPVPNVRHYEAGVGGEVEGHWEQEIKRIVRGTAALRIQPE